MRLLMCLGLLTMLGAGCDSSKQELESTKSTLADVSKERDDLKTQLANVQKQLDESKVELAKAKAPPAAPTPGKTPPAALAAKTPAAGKDAKAKHVQ